MADTETDSEQGAVCDALEQTLTTVHTKIAAVLFALSDGVPLKGVNRADMVAPLEKLSVGNVSSALQRARIEANGDDCYKHNGKSAGEARLAITERGVRMVQRLFASEQGQVDEAGVAWMVDAIKSLAAEPDEPADKDDKDDPPPSAKRARRAGTSGASTPQPSPATGVQARIVLDTDEDEDNGALEKRLKALLKAHDNAIDQDALAELYGTESAKFYKEHGRAPGADEAAALLRSAQVEQSAKTSLGGGIVSRAEISTLLRKVLESATLPEMVKSLEARAAATE